MNNWYLRSFFSHSNASFKDRFKFALGALIFPVQTRRWRRFLHENSGLSELAQRYPRMLHKIYRPYLSKHLRCVDRVDILIAHYSRLIKEDFGGLIQQAASRPVPVAQFFGKSGTLFDLTLSALNVGHREGELTLQLINEGICIYSSSFVFINVQGRPGIQIGALQGLRSNDGALVIKRVTRELFGCRPKKLMVTVMRDIGAYFGCTAMQMVSNKNRVAINYRRSRRISSNYDETWEEMLATRRPDGNFEMPCVESAPANFEQVPSHKRAEAKRRSALLAMINTAIHANFNLRKICSNQPAQLAKINPVDDVLAIA